MDLINLWRTEWKRGDFDWIESLKGDYAETLRFSVVQGRIENQLAATATAIQSKEDPRVALISSVMVGSVHRGLGLGAEATKRTMTEAAKLGAEVCYLGTAQWPQNVYQKIGFKRWNGNVMRHELSGRGRLEEVFFAKGQLTLIRKASWGDATGFVTLVVQPLSTRLLSFQNSIFSGPFQHLRRCVSNFPTLYSSSINSGGNMLILQGDRHGQALGFAIWSRRGSGLDWNAILDVATHDNYHGALGALINEACQQAQKDGVRILTTLIHPLDSEKIDALKQQGFELIALLQMSESTSMEFDPICMQKRF
jgi:N-acetylglutamate synthase-like GNAT family acetyltransferase